MRRIFMIGMASLFGAPSCHEVLGIEEARPGWTAGAGSGGNAGSGPTCTDDLENGSETGTDCGGSCAPCPDGEGCKVGPDCQSKSCVNGTCAGAACKDQLQNGDETDIDCGGPGCPACADGKVCTTDGDCESAICKVTCQSNYVWAKQFGDGAAQRVNAVAVDGLGNALVVGTAAGIVDFGSGPQPTASVPSPFLAVLDKSGSQLGYGGVFPVTGMGGAAMAVGVDKFGGALFAGLLSGSLKLDASTTVSGSGFTSLLLAGIGKFGGTSGKAYGGGSGMYGQAVSSMAVDSAGNIVLTGDLHSADFGCGTISATGANILFVAKLDAQFNCLWSKGFGNGVTVTTPAVAVDSTGNVVLTGGLHNSGPQPIPATIDFGSGHVITTAGPDLTAVFIAKLDAAAGTATLAKAFGDAAGGGSATSIAVSPSGDIVLTGKFNGMVDFGGGPLTAAGASGLFIAKLDAVGKHIWSYPFGDASVTPATKPRGVAVDAAGNVAVAGDFDGALDFGGGPLAAQGTTDVFVVRLDDGGKHLWSRRYGGASTQTVGGVAMAPGGYVILAGTFAGQIDFGGGGLESAGGEDIFVAKLLTP